MPWPRTYFGLDSIALIRSRLGYMMPPHELQRIFMMMDMDRSGRVNEREFCEFWGFYGY